MLNTDTIPDFYLTALNQIFELEKRLADRLETERGLARAIRRLKNLFSEELPLAADGAAGLYYHDPLGEPYPPTRTDCEASIAGPEVESLVISEVIKPIIYLKAQGNNYLVQRGIVIVTAS